MTGRFLLVGALAISIGVVVAGACAPQGQTAPTSSPLGVASPSATATPTPVPTPTATPVPTPTPKPTPVPLPPTTTFNFVFDAGVSEQDRADIRDGAALASVFAINTFGNDPARTITVAVHKGESPYSCCFTTSSTRIDIYVDLLAFNSPNVAPGTVGIERRKLMVHEYMHTLDYARGCPRDGVAGSPKVPVWLHEGIAEYSAFAAVIGAGLLSSAQVRRYQIGGLTQYTLATTTLRSSEVGYTGFSYSLAYMALDQLLIGKSISTWSAFCEAVAPGRDWHAAFATAFGVSVEEFYQAFDTYRKSPS